MKSTLLSLRKKRLTSRNVQEMYYKTYRETGIVLNGFVSVKTKKSFLTYKQQIVFFSIIKS